MSGARRALLSIAVVAYLGFAWAIHAQAGGFGPAQGASGGTDTLGNITPTDGNFAVGDGADWVAESGNTARTSLGLGTGDSPTFTGLSAGGAERVNLGDGTFTTFKNGAGLNVIAVKPAQPAIQMSSASLLLWTNGTEGNAGTIDTNLGRTAAGELTLLGAAAADTGVIKASVVQPGALHLAERTAPTGTANVAKLYAVDNGSGKTQLVVIFGSGAAQVLATEP